MKKLFTIGVLMFMAVTLSAQAPLKINTVTGYPQIKQMPKMEALTKPESYSRFGQSNRATDSYWVNYPEAVDTQFATGALITAILWPDSLGYVTDGKGSGFHWWIHGFGSVFDPNSYYIGEYLEASNWFSEYQSYKVDSLAFGYMYDRRVETYNNDSIVDTVMVYFVNPDSLFLGQFNGWPQAGDTPQVAVIPYDESLNSPPAGTIAWKDTILLTQKDTTLGSDQFEFIEIPIAPSFEIEPGKQLAVTFQYKPGKPYSLGDTILEQSTPPVEVGNAQNLFRLIVFEEEAGAYPKSVFDDETYNMGSIATSEVRYPAPNSNWKGSYISALAYNASFRLEHPYVFWHVTPTGASFTASPTAGNCKTVEFTDVSNFGPTKWAWIYDDDSSTVKTGANVTYEFPESGVYDVCLLAENDTVSYTYCERVRVFCSSIEDNNDFELQLYPNPASDHIIISTLISEYQDHTITMYDLQGREVYNKTVNKSPALREIVDVKGLPNGLYTVKVQSNKGIAVKKILVQ